MSWEIHIAAAVVVDADGRFLLVRKRGTTAFIQPGGKMEPGEPPHLAVRRELLEELGVEVSVTEADFIGRARAVAVNEPDRIVVAHLFRVSLPAAPQPAAEIEELVWLRPDETGDRHIASLTRDHVLTLA